MWEVKEDWRVSVGGEGGLQRKGGRGLRAGVRWMGCLVLMVSCIKWTSQCQIQAGGVRQTDLNIWNAYLLVIRSVFLMLPPSITVSL